MRIKFCENCKFFRRHYVRSSRGNYTPLMYGHCTKPQRKNRYGDERGCSFWQENEDANKNT